MLPNGRRVTGTWYIVPATHDTLLIFFTEVHSNQDLTWCVKKGSIYGFWGPTWVLITYNICPPGIGDISIIRTRWGNKQASEADNYGIWKAENKTGFPLCGVETHTRPLASLVLLQSLPGQRKKRAFRTQHLAAAASPRLTGHGS